MGSSVCITFADAFIRNDSWLLRCLQQGSRFIISLGSELFVNGSDRDRSWSGDLSLGNFWNLKVRMQSHTVHGRNPVDSPVEVTLVVEIPLFTTFFFPSQVAIAGFLPSNSYWRLPNKYLKKSDEHQFGLVIHSMMSASIYNSKLSGWLIWPLVEPRVKPVEALCYSTFLSRVNLHIHRATLQGFPHL